jgi:hypothetical protein
MQLHVIQYRFNIENIWIGVMKPKALSAGFHINTDDACNIVQFLF